MSIKAPTPIALSPKSPSLLFSSFHSPRLRSTLSSPSALLKMLSPNFKIILLGLISLASVVRGDPSSTTTTSVTTTTTTTSLYTSTSTIQGDDFTTSETLTLTQEAATPHVPGTTTLKALTATVTAPAPTATTTSHACTNFHLSFGKSCCPKKSHCHKKPKPKPKKSKGKKKSRALSSDELYSLAKRQQYAVDSNDGKLYYRCGAAEYQDNNLSTDLGYETTVYTDHVFDTPKYVLFSDIYDPNVCGDLKVDGVKVGSTNCPELTEPNGKFAGGTGQNANNAQDAIKSGIYGYGFFFIPAGTHTVTFLETYMGGAASFALFPACEIQVDTEVISTEVQTSSSATPTVTYTLDPTLTITESFSETTFTTPNAVTDLVFTETPAQVTSTFTPAPVPTTVFQCNSLSIDIQCPRLTSAKQLNNWMVSKLNYYNARTGTEADVAVRCGSVDYTEYYYY